MLALLFFMFLSKIEIIFQNELGENWYSSPWLKRLSHFFNICYKRDQEVALWVRLLGSISFDLT